MVFNPAWGKIPITRHPYEGTQENADGDLVPVFGQPQTVEVYGWAQSVEKSDGVYPKLYTFSNVIDVYGPSSMEWGPFDEATVTGKRYRVDGGVQIWRGPVQLDGAVVRMVGKDG